MLKRATQRTDSFTDAVGTPCAFAPFVHAPAPDPDEPGTRAAYAAIALRARLADGRSAPDARDSAGRQSGVRGRFIERYGAYLAATAMGAATIGVIGGAFLLAARFGADGGGSGQTSIDISLLVALSPLVVAAATLALWRHFLVVRPRVRAAITPLLELGLCASCGQALHGASPVGGSDAGVGEFAGAPLCACGECGARWPVGASQAPFHPDGTSLGNAFPLVEESARWRSRRALRRALRAMPEDFTLDAAGDSRYIATGAGSRGGSSSIALDLAADCGRAALCSILPVIGCIAIIFSFSMLHFVLAVAFGIGSSGKTTLNVLQVISIVWIAIGGFDTSRRRSRARRVRKAVRAALAAETCPTCTNGLVRVPASTLYESCSCCGSTWRRT